MIDYYKRITDAHTEIDEMPKKDRTRIMETFSKFRHLTLKKQDQFLESIRSYDKLYSMTLQIQQDDDMRGIHNE